MNLINPYLAASAGRSRRPSLPSGLLSGAVVVGAVAATGLLGVAAASAEEADDPAPCGDPTTAQCDPAESSGPADGSRTDASAVAGEPGADPEQPVADGGRTPAGDGPTVVTEAQPAEAGPEGNGSTPSDGSTAETDPPGTAAPADATPPAVPAGAATAPGVGAADPGAEPVQQPVGAPVGEGVAGTQEAGTAAEPVDERGLPLAARASGGTGNEEPVPPDTEQGRRLAEALGLPTADAAGDEVPVSPALVGIAGDPTTGDPVPTDPAAGTVPTDPAGGTVPTDPAAGPAPAAGTVPAEGAAPADAAEGGAAPAGEAPPAAPLISTETIVTTSAQLIEALRSDDPRAVQDVLVGLGVDVGVGQLEALLVDAVGDDVTGAISPVVSSILTQALTGTGTVDWDQVRQVAVAAAAGELIDEVPGLDGGLFAPVGDTGAQLLGLLAGDEPVSDEQLVALARQLGVDAVENGFSSIDPVLGGGIGALAGMFATGSGNPVSFVSAIANGFVPGLGALLDVTLGSWFARAEAIRQLAEQEEEYRDWADASAVNDASTNLDWRTMEPLRDADGEIVYWADTGLPVLDRRTATGTTQYGTGYYMNGMDTLELLDDRLAQYLPEPTGRVQDEEFAEQQEQRRQARAQLSDRQQELLERYAPLDADIRGDGYATAPDDLGVEQGTAAGWRALYYGALDIEEATLHDRGLPQPGLASEELRVRTDVEAAVEELDQLLQQQIRDAVGPDSRTVVHRVRAGWNGGTRPEQVPADAGEGTSSPDALARIEELRQQIVDGTTALRLAGSPLPDDVVAEFEQRLDAAACPADSYCTDTYEQVGQQVMYELGRLTADDFAQAAAAPSAAAQALAAEIAAAREQRGVAQNSADFVEQVQDPCGEGRPAQLECFDAWRDFLNPAGGAGRYSSDTLDLVQTAYGYRVARRDLMGRDVEPFDEYLTGPQVQAPTE